MEVKEVVKSLLANGAKKIDGIKVKNVTISVEENYTRCHLSINKEVDGYVLQEDGTYTKGNVKGIFTSLFSLASILKDNEDAAFAANHIINNPNTIGVVLSGATVTIVQEPIIAGQVRKNPWSDNPKAKEETFDHDTIINHVVDIELSSFGIKQLEKLAEKLMGF